MNIQIGSVFVLASQRGWWFKDFDTAPRDVFFCAKQTLLVIGNELVRVDFLCALVSAFEQNVCVLLC